MADSWNPELYARFSTERSQPFYDLLSEVKIPAGADIVDLGCGTGEWTLKLFDKLESRFGLGVDNSSQMLAKAKEFSKPGQLEFVQSSIEDWTASKPFDLIFSNAALHWCGDHPGLLSKFQASLKNGGQLALQLPVNHDYATHRVAMEMAGERHWIRRLGGELQDFASDILTPSDYAKHLYQLGFAEQKVYVRVYAHVLENREDVIDWVKGTTLTRFQGALPSIDYEEFVREYRERLFRELPDERPFFFPFKRLFLIARRSVPMENL